MTELAADVEVRPFRPEDVPSRIALFRQLNPALVMTPEGFRHSLANESPRARTRLWSALAAGEVVGAGMARFAHDTERDDLAYLWVGIHPERRGGGLGGRLYELAEAYVLEEGARKLESWVLEDAAGTRFAKRRGFEPTRSAQFWTLDPRTVDVGDLPRLERERAAEGLRLVPLRAVRERERELHALFAEVVADVPDDEPHTRIPFEEWRRSALEAPDLSLDGSFVALDGERPVALAWLGVDRDGGRGSHWMTGTARDHRRRGLARLVKLATIRWAAEHGITTLHTDNDSTNADMLALNEHLGYRPTLTGTTYAKTV